MDIKVANVLTVHQPTEEVKAWCKENLKLPNPEYAKKVRMGFWVGNTPKELCLYTINGDDWILPYGCLLDILRICPQVHIIPGFATPTEVDFGAEIPLYDYQEIAVEAMKKANHGILQSPPGSGKTQCGIALASRIGRRTLWVAHTLDLTKQSYERAQRFMDKEKLGLIQEGKIHIGSAITFATVQTLSHMDLLQYRDFWDTIIVDEAHRVGMSPTSMTMYQKVLNNLSARHKYGLSATVHRADGMIKATFALLGPVAYVVPEEAVGDKIMKVGICPIGTGIGVSRQCLNTDGTLNYAGMISYLAENKTRNEVIVKQLIEERGKSCLILSDRLGHLETLLNSLPDDMWGDAVMVSGKMTTKKGKAEREQAIEDMRTGKKKYLFATYSLAKEGLDIPRLERLFLATPQKDYAVITQSIGRIARVFEGKADPIAYDFVDDIGFLVKAYKKRCSTYKKNDCYWTGGI